MMPMATSNRISFVCGVVVIVLAFVCEANEGGFVTTRGTQFVLDGSPFVFNGFNSYWMMTVAADPSNRYKVSEVFRDAAAAGLSVCRTLAFSDGGVVPLQISPGVYDEPHFQALDFVISEAKKYKIRLILSLVNNWKNFGGRAQYVEWARSAGVKTTNDDDFYTNPVVKGYYKNHIKRVLTRVNTITQIAYKDDPTIMAWELINEPRCDTDYSGRTLDGWVQEMAPYVKSLDNKHLLEIGLEGFYGDSIPDKKKNNPGYQVGTDFISNDLVKEIDFTTIHAYPDNWYPDEDDDGQMAFMERWMTSHWEDSRNIVKKPFVVGEFGRLIKAPRYNLNGRDKFMNSTYTSIYNMAKKDGSFGGSLVWQIVAKGMENINDGYSIVLSETPSTKEVISHHSHLMKELTHSLELSH